MNITFYKDGDKFFRLPVVGQNPCIETFHNRCPLNRIVGVFQCVGCLFCSYLPQREKVLNTVNVEIETTIFLLEENESGY